MSSDRIYITETVFNEITRKGKQRLLLLFTEDLIFMRTLMCIACMTSYFGVLLLIFSFKCVRAVEDEGKRKDWLAFWSGFLFLIAGKLVKIGVVGTSVTSYSKTSC